MLPESWLDTIEIIKTSAYSKYNMTLEACDKKYECDWTKDGRGI